MRCLVCGYFSDCPCEFQNGVCWTCTYGGKRLENKSVDNYCNQSLENLQLIKNSLNLSLQDKVINYQYSIVNSQIKQFNKNPCRFKTIIDKILVN